MLISEGQKVCTLKNVMVLCVGCILLFYICNDHNITIGYQDTW